MKMKKTNKDIHVPDTLLPGMDEHRDEADTCSLFGLINLFIGITVGVCIGIVITKFHLFFL